MTTTGRPVDIQTAQSAQSSQNTLHAQTVPAAQAAAPAAPEPGPQLIAPDTYLIPNLVPAEPGTFVFVSSLVILAKEPIIVETGAPLHREQWLRNVSSIVDLDDVRWVFLSHDDGDHLGNMHPILDLAPDAVVVANFFSNERAALEPGGGDGPDIPLVETLAHPAQGPEAQVERAQLGRRVNEALQGLNEDQRQALMLFCVEGLGYREISERLGVPVGTVGTWVLRGRRALQHCVSEDES